jgi:aminobenzoyl-glutamate utilization protein B
MESFRSRMREYYYDPARFDTYLEQLGIDYPQLEKPPSTNP